MPYADWTYEIRIPLTISGLTHNYVWTVKPDQTNPNWNVPGKGIVQYSVVTRSSGIELLSDVAADIADLYKPFYDNTVSIAAIDVWLFAPGTSDGQYIVTIPYSITGTGATAPVLAHYQMYTFRTLAGGIKRIVILEDTSTANNKTPLSDPTLGAGAVALRDYVLGVNSPVIGADGTFCIAGLFRSQGQNEAVWRKRYRPDA